MLDRNVENEILPWCYKNKITILAYSPMEKGLLTGKISSGREFSKDDTRS